MKWTRPPPVSFTDAALFLAGVALLCFGALATLGLFAYLLDPGLSGLGSAQSACFDSERPGEKAILTTFRFIDNDGVDIAADPARRRRLLCDPSYRPRSAFGGLIWIAPDPDGLDQAPFLVGPNHEKPLAFLAARVDRIHFLEDGNVGCARPEVGAFYDSRNAKTINICPRTANKDVLWLPLLMHEARHADDKPHVACHHGSIVWVHGCDKTFAEYGAYRISYEVSRDISRSNWPERWVKRAAADMALTELLEHFSTLSPEFIVKTGAYVIAGGNVRFFDGNQLDLVGGANGVYLARALGRMPGYEAIVVMDREGSKRYYLNQGRRFPAAATIYGRTDAFVRDRSFGSDAQDEDVLCRLERRRYSCVSTAHRGGQFALELPFEAEHLLFKGDPRLSMEQLPFVAGNSPEDAMVTRLLAGKFPGTCIALISSTNGDIYAVHRELGDFGRPLLDKLDSGHGILAAGSIAVGGKPRALVLRTDHRVYLYDENGIDSDSMFDGREVDDLLLPEILTDASGQ